MFQPIRQRPSVVQLEEMAAAARLGVGLALEDRVSLAGLSQPAMAIGAEGPGTLTGYHAMDP